MRIGVLEWASCGGMNDSADLSDSILTEGWAMCRAAMLGLVQAGHQAVAIVTPQCASDPLVSGYRAAELELVELSAHQPAWDQWRQLYADCEYTLCIAPECNRILERLLRWCQGNGVRTCNCGPAFVRLASDKMRTARNLLNATLPHPPTQLLVDAQRRWETVISSQPTGDCSREVPTWVIKPRDGVGCEGMLRVTANELSRFGGFARQPALAVHGELSPKEQRRWIVQPWYAGEALSRAAIADRSGQLHWLPVTRQRLAMDPRVAYLGGSVEPEFAASIPGLDHLLTRAVRALGMGSLGWVGIDFLYDASNVSQPLTIIEINPRLTTSFVGLTAAGAPGLAAAIVAAACGQPVEVPSRWQAVRFTAAGDCPEFC